MMCNIMMVIILILHFVLPFNMMVSQKIIDDPRPNVIIILADDLGYADLGVYGGEAKTPHLDRLAQEGVRFTDFHSNGPVCSPTRAALLTGRYQQRMGIESALGENALGLGNRKAEGEITIADYLSQKGYKTGIIGKWHLGYHQAQNPVSYGFDEFRGMLHGAVDYHSHVNQYGRFDWWHNKNIVKEEGYVTNLITDHSEVYIEKRKDEPFFLYISHLAIHFPWQTPQDSAYQEEGKRNSEGFALPNKLGPHPPEETGEVVIKMIEELDKSVGRIMAKVKELDIENRTMIIFVSDNGGYWKYEWGDYLYTEISSNGPLRGQKGSLYEGGHRVPAIAWWPGMIEAGRVSDETGMTMDLLPTIIELANINITEKGFNTLDGISLLPHLLKGVNLPSRTLYWRSGNSYAVRKDEWKLVVSNEDNLPELYNLKNDIGETTDLAEQYPELVEKLLSEFHIWHQEVSQ